MPDFNIPERYAVTTPEFRELYGKRGVYLLYGYKDATKPTYIGRAKTDAARTIARHFQKWNAKELKFVERDPKQLDTFYVEFIEMPTATDEEVVEKETDLIEKYQPYLNIRKNVLKQKNPDYYKMTEEKRELLDKRVKEYEEEQDARMAYERAVYEYEQAEAQRQAMEELAEEKEKQAAQAKSLEEKQRAEMAAEMAADKLETAEQKAAQAEKKVEKIEKSKAFKAASKRIPFNRYKR